jgi:hypothetical protein
MWSTEELSEMNEEKFNLILSWSAVNKRWWNFKDDFCELWSDGEYFRQWDYIN